MASSTASDAVKAGYWFCTSKVPPDHINSNLFTHLYAGFAKVKCPIPPGENFDLVIQFPDNYRGLFENFPKTVKTKNPGVKALLSIGGGSPLYVKPPDVSEDISATITAVVGPVATEETANLRKKFIDRSIYLARKHNYDGLDLCWLYPSNADQKPQLASLLKAWRDAVDQEHAQHINWSKLLLTATVFHHPVIQDVRAGINFTYPSGEMSAYLDWVNVLAVDFYDPSSTNLTGPVHAWLSPNQDQTRCGKGGIENWIANGVVSKKLVLGLPFYGHQWTLGRSDANGLFAAASSAGKDYQYLAFKSIQNDYVNPNPNNLKYDEGHVAAYWHSQSAWIGFDDARCISTKVRAAKDKNLRGYLAWHVGGDDDKCTLSTEAHNAWPE